MRTAVILLALLLTSAARADALGEALAVFDAARNEPRPAHRARTLRVGRQGREKPSAAKQASTELTVLLDGASEERALEALVSMLEDGDERPTGTSAIRSRSQGWAHAGALGEALQLPAHAAYVIRDRSRAWGTAETIAWLTQAFDQILATDAGAPRVWVHDLSLEHGGPMDGHKSHQSGRDVDLAYYRRGCPGDCTAHSVVPAELDADRQWRLLWHWLEREQAEFIFVDYALQRPLHEAAEAAGATAEQLARWFQFPRGPSYPAGVVRHVDNHANHLHVRFRCPEGDSACRNTMVQRTAAGDLELFELDADESELLELLAE